MKFCYAIVLTLIFSFVFISCGQINPNEDQDGVDILDAHLVYAENPNITYHDTVYVPIYSDIYSETKHTKFLLTATLSIRNTSLKDSIYIEDIDYYNTQGEVVRHYLSKTLLLSPMQSIDYVIEEKDNEGGTGANFIVNWGASSNHLKPIFQGVMISTHGQQGISFLTEGVSISEFRQDTISK